MSSKILNAALIGGSALFLVACGGEATVDTAPVHEAATSVESAITNADRTQTDISDDSARKPRDVLNFVGLKAGDTVFEIEAGAGYYTELLSKIVGPEGSVIMQNPPSFDAFVGERVTERLLNNRLSNVRLLKSNFDMLDASDQSVDVATWFLGPHELYFRPPGVETFGDVEATYGEIFRILKPGGRFVVLDHAAPAGMPESTGNDQHRIDPAIVKTLASGAGFELIDESDVLANPGDQYELGVFDPAVRRKTDRFLLKFQKPG